MSRFKTARRRTLLTLLATLLSVPAVVAGATPASADPKCVGQIAVHVNSRASSIVSYFRTGSNGILRPGQSARGNEGRPIVRFGTPPDRGFQVVYRDLRDLRHLRTDTLDRGGFFDINPCHWGTITVY